MNEIYESRPSGRRGYQFDDFQARFREICQEHKSQGRAVACAFILCDSRHPQVRRVLQDDIYWDALDAISGDRLTIFTFSVTGREAEAFEPEPGVLYDMIAVYGAVGPLHQLDEFFALDEPLEMPAIVFFQVSDNAVIDAFGVPLHEKRFEDAYLEIVSLIEAATDSVAEVSTDDTSSPEIIFESVRRAARKQGRKLKLRRWATKAKPIAGLVSALGGLL